jgi:hypothetical protein
MDKLNKKHIGNIYIVINKNINHILFLEYIGYTYSIQKRILQEFKLLNNYKSIYMYYESKDFNNYILCKIDLPFDVLSYIKKFI